MHRVPGEGRIRNILRPAFTVRLPRLARLVELAVFPSFCKTCGMLLDAPRDRVMCRACLDKLAPHRGPSCPSCGRFFEGEGDDHLCGTCLESPPPFSLHRSAGRYRGLLKDAVLLLKYRSSRPLGPELGRFAHDTLKGEEGLWWGTSAVVPVPLHSRRRRERGFNQAEVAAGEVARLAGLPLERKALIKVRNTAAQTSLDQADRAINVKGAYAVAAPVRLRGKALLLVDDVYTTGATLRECASALKKAGAKDVRALTIAQA